MGPHHLSKDQQTLYCRIFILGGKGASERDWRDTFDKYGKIANIWITKDRNTGEDKGITYITYEKTSEACHAMEEMNGKFMADHARPLKVILASDKGSRRSIDEGKMLMRLFIIVPKGQDEEDVRDHFSQFGEIDYVRPIKDRKTGQNKGLAYVKYTNQFHGAKAFEECDRCYKPIFADVKPKDDDPRDNDYGYSGGRVGGGPDHRGGGGGYDRGGSGYDYGFDDSRGGGRGSDRMMDRGGGSYRGGGGSSRHDIEPIPAPLGPMEMLRGYNHWDECRIEALIPEVLSEEHVFKLFDLIPGLKSCGMDKLSEVLSEEHVFKLFDLIPGLKSCGMDKLSGIAFLEYSTAECAAYAKDKVHGMEYPPGYRISVRFPLGSRQDARGPMSGADGMNHAASSINSSLAGLGAGIDVPSNLSSLVESIQKATQVLQTAGIAPSGLGGQETVRWCNVPLPTKKPFAPRDSSVDERLFIVSHPDGCPDNVIEDALCRFGGLISAYFMPGKTYGYAKFADKESARMAVEVLHGQQVCGNRLKVMLADPPKYERDDYPDTKRPRNS